MWSLEEKSKERKGKERNHEFRPLIFFAPHMWFWYLKWQYACFAIVKWIEQSSIQSNRQNCTRSWKCPRDIRYLKWLVVRPNEATTNNSACGAKSLSPPSKQEWRPKAFLLSRIGPTHQNWVTPDWSSYSFHAQLVHWKQKQIEKIKGLHMHDVGTKILRLEMWGWRKPRRPLPFV